MSPHLPSPAALGRPLALLVLMLTSDGVTGSRGNTRPNFVLIMADDLGIGDVGCYGNDTIRTPNIDRLAGEGVRLSQHIAAAPLCTPSRAAFLTGRYALRSGLASLGRVPVLLFLAGSGGLPPTETTFAKRLQQQGYTTGLVGKWHLGVSCVSRGDHCHHPNQQGFQFYYGMPFTLFFNCVSGRDVDVMADVALAIRQLALLLSLGLLTLVCLRVCGLLRVSVRLLVTLACVGATVLAVLYVPFGFLQRWNCIIMRNQEVVEQPLVTDTLSHRMLTEAQNFLTRSADQPFLLFFSLAHVHTPLFHNPAFAGKSRHGAYGDNVEEMDWIIGEVMHKLDSLGLANNTMVYFTSDHGGHIEDPTQGGWNGIYKGGKGMGGWEGGIRVPGIFRWPGRLPAGRVVHQPTSLMDLYPTLKHLAQDTQPDRPLDGFNLMPLLEGSSDVSQHQFMFHYCGGYLNAVRWQPPGSDSVFKVHYFTPNFAPPEGGSCQHREFCGRRCYGKHVTYHDPPLVYDLSRDPGESRPLSASTEPRFAEILERTGRAAAAHRASLTEGRGQDGVGGGTEQAVDSQMTWQSILWRPWLQPCCGTFPFCGCLENTTLTE